MMGVSCSAAKTARQPTHAQPAVTSGINIDKLFLPSPLTGSDEEEGCGAGQVGGVGQVGGAGQVGDAGHVGGDGIVSW